MKKTVSVNIKGLNFMIEEDAYELLHQYMTRLERNLSPEKGAKEIIEDIELRIAELCQAYLSDKKTVIEKVDIEKIIAVLGQPEDFIDEEEKEHSYSYHGEQSAQRERKLYRDVENAKIAGVCAGLSNYFNIDVMVIRFIFIILLIMGAFGFPLYIILWIIIPKANSTIDRLKMQGKNITVDSVREEIENAAERVKTNSASLADKLRKENQLGKRFSSIGRALTSVLGIGFIGTGLFFLVVFLILFFGGLKFIPIQNEGGYLSFSQLGELILSESGDTFLAWLGIIMTAFSVILFMVSNGTYILLRLKNRWAKIASISLVILSTIGFCLCLYIGIKAGKDMSSEAAISKKSADVYTNELIVQTMGSEDLNLGEYRASKHHFGPHFDPILVKRQRLHDSGVNFIFKPSKDSSYHIYQELSAHSFVYKDAVEKAKNINHQMHLDSSVLYVRPNFSYPKKDKIRGQSVCVIIEVPTSKWVRIGDERIGFDPTSIEESEKWGYLNSDGAFEYWD